MYLERDKCTYFQILVFESYSALDEYWYLASNLLREFTVSMHF